jgi:type I restriction enzyme, S subunit
MIGQCNVMQGDDVNADWLVNLPWGWQSARLKAVANLRKSRVSDPVTEDNYVGLENIESWTGRLLKVDQFSLSHNDDGEDTATVSQFLPGDVLFGKLRPYLAKAYLAQEAGLCTTELLVIKPGERLNEHFLLNVVLTQEFIGQANAATFGTRMPRADWDTIANIQIPIPPFAHQRAIVEYLDQETAKLDELIAAKQRLLELLAEKRRALITHAVTRGLNPSAPLRDSGVPWLGAVPAHWEVTAIKHIARVGNGSTPLRENAAYWQDGTYPWLTSTVVNDDVVGKPVDWVTPIALRDCHLPIVSPNSVLVALTGQGKTRGKAAILPYEATINQHMAFISPTNGSVDPEFLQLSLTASYELLRMLSEGTGSTKGALTCEQLGAFPITLPPLAEQKQIVSNLKIMRTTIDDLSEVTQQTILLLHERRSALIAAAVTGQIDVTKQLCN